MEPQIRYCTTKDGIRIAYAVAGAGPPLVYLPPTASHVALEWRVPTLRRRYEWLARRHTLIRFDAPGTGLSQRTGFEPDGERDIETIADVLGLAAVAGMDATIPMPPVPMMAQSVPFSSTMPRSLATGMGCA